MVKHKKLVCGGIYSYLSGSNFKENLEEIFENYKRTHVKASFDPKIPGFEGVHKRTKKVIKVIFGGSDEKEIDKLLSDPKYENIERCVYAISEDEVTVRDSLLVFSNDLMGIKHPEDFGIKKA